MDDNETTTNPVVPEPSPQEPSAPIELPIQLSVQDLAAVVSVIDLAVQRGAFRAHEITQVGTVFDKVSQFVNTINKAQEDNKENT